MDKKQTPNTEWVEGLWKIFCFLLSPFPHLVRGIITNTIPWTECFLASSLVCLLIRLRVDFRAFESLDLALLYPSKPEIYWPYFFLLVLSPFWWWGVIETIRKRQLIDRLTELFNDAKLVTSMGKLPGFIFDRPMDEFTRKLRLSRKTLPLSKFHEARPYLEAGLRIYIDEYRDTRSTKAGNNDRDPSIPCMQRRTWVSSGEPLSIGIPFVKIGGLLRFRKEELIEWLHRKEL